MIYCIMKLIEYPNLVAAQLVVYDVDIVNELISKTKHIHTAYVDILYLNSVLENRIYELERENEFLNDSINEITNRISYIT